MAVSDKVTKVYGLTEQEWLPWKPWCDPFKDVVWMYYDVPYKGVLFLWAGPEHGGVRAPWEVVWSPYGKAQSFPEYRREESELKLAATLILGKDNHLRDPAEIAKVAEKLALMGILHEHAR